MLMECPLNSTPGTKGADSSNINDSHYKSSKDVSIAQKFLDEHNTAKIVFIVDTHCLENGFFVYQGDSPNTYNACSLLEVSLPCVHSPPLPDLNTPVQILSQCPPKGIFQYLSNDPKAPKHNHKSIIINLACGASISVAGARTQLLDG